VAARTTPLIAAQHKQLRVDGEQLSDCVFARAAGLHGWANGLNPVGGDRFDALFAADHERERTQRVASAVGAMAGWLAATSIREHERTRESIGGNAKAREQLALAAFQAGGVGASRLVRLRHLIVILLSDRSQDNTCFECSGRFSDGIRIALTIATAGPAGADPCPGSFFPLPQNG
jgi:hypothetical protein